MTIRINYLFVDYENTQKVDLDLIAGRPAVVFLVLGGGQGRTPKDLTLKVHKYSAQVRMIDPQQSFEIGGARSIASRIMSEDDETDGEDRLFQGTGFIRTRSEVFRQVPAHLCR